MQLIIQRVLEAEVTVDEVEIAKIDVGYLVYLCFQPNDTEDVIKKAAKKLKTLKMANKTAILENESFLFISNFTLLGKIKGNGISYHNSMEKSKAEGFYHLFLEEIKKLHQNIQNGQYGSRCKIKSTVYGPFNLIVDFKPTKL
ncbi:D-tyrosyl-tRNA(Tyr) deacylase [Pseudoloma neurophilia]|uniref:D-aminoacyl-tRNA deacylase n=1 Tax=Pseudoloma neurophilia TaxID=146866 RepID=A0A0R0M1C8_9MICR|nr:D-tyrosyl-tRNA(Tyr) deacylase [Pseudoloma neurophilia]